MCQVLAAGVACARVRRKIGVCLRNRSSFFQLLEAEGGSFQMDGHPLRCFFGVSLSQCTEDLAMFFH